MRTKDSVRRNTRSSSRDRNSAVNAATLRLRPRRTSSAAADGIIGGVVDLSSQPDDAVNETERIVSRTEETSNQNVSATTSISARPITAARISRLLGNIHPDAESDASPDSTADATNNIESSASNSHPDNASFIRQPHGPIPGSRSRGVSRRNTDAVDSVASLDSTADANNNIESSATNSHPDNASFIRQPHGPIPGSRSRGVSRRNTDAVDSVSSDSILDLLSSSDSSSNRPIEEIVISDTESNEAESIRSDSQTIGAGIDIKTLETMLVKAVEKIPIEECMGIDVDEKRETFMSSFSWPWKEFVDDELVKIANDFFCQFYCPIAMTWLCDPVKLKGHYFSKATITRICHEAQSDMKSYFWHPMTREEISVKRQFNVDSVYSKKVDKAMRLEEKINFQFLRKVIEANPKHTESSSSAAKDSVLSTSEIQEINSSAPVVDNNNTVLSASEIQQINSTLADTSSTFSNECSSATKLKKMPHDWVETEGFMLAHKLLVHAKEVGWGNSLSYGKRGNYFEQYSNERGWFSNGGIFSEYITYAAKGMQRRFRTFESWVKKEYRHIFDLTDESGLLGREVPPEAMLYMELTEFEKRDTTALATGATRKRKNETICNSIVPRGPCNGNMLDFSHLSANNPNASTAIVPAIGNDIVPFSYAAGIENIATQNAKLNEFKCGQTASLNLSNQVVEFMNTLKSQVGSIVNNPVMLARQPGDILKEYKDAVDGLERAKKENNKDDQHFYEKMKSKLQKEL